MNNSTRFPHLLDAEILRGFSEIEKAAFLNSCILKTYRRDSVVLSQGEAATGMFLVGKGEIQIGYLCVGGHHSIIYHSIPGQIMGAVEAISGELCSATCTSLGESEILFCPISLLDKLLQSTVFVRNFAISVYHDFCHDNKYKSIDQFCSVEQKVCLYLEKLSAPDAVFCHTQTYLANVVGCSRQTVNRELGHLRDRQIIEMSKEGIKILDNDALARRVEELDTQRRGPLG